MNWLTTSASPPTSVMARFMRPAASSKTLSFATFSPSREGVVVPYPAVSIPTREYEQSPADLTDAVSVHPDGGANHTLDDDAHAQAI